MKTLVAQVNGEAGINVDKDGGDNAMAMNQTESASVSFKATAERVCVLFTLLMFTSGSLLFEKLVSYHQNLAPGPEHPDS